MSAGPALGIDIGALTVTIATADGVRPLPTPAGGPAEAVRAALSAIRTPGAICVGVPDTWLSGTVEGAARQEEARHECEDRARTGRVGWAGTLAAACACAAASRGRGRYLVCDIGGTGVRAGAFDVSGSAVRIGATHAEPGGGWLDFDAAVRAALPRGQAAGLPATWGEQAAGQRQDRAVRVFTAALGGIDEERDTPVYRITGTGGEVVLTAGPLIDAFAPAQSRLRTAIAAAGNGTRPDHVVLTGGLSWLPLAARTVLDAVGPGTGPVVLGANAAAHGALLLARGDAAVVPPEGGIVSLPINRIRDGLLKGENVELPWTESFAAFPDGPLPLDGEELTVSVSGQLRVARLPGLVPGPHQIGVRYAWPGPGVLVVRPTGAGGTAHVVPLAGLAER